MSACHSSQPRLWRQSSHWRLEPLPDENRYIAHDSVTDRRVRLCQDAVLVLRAFELPVTLAEVYRQIHRSESALTVERVSDICRDFRQAGMLVPQDPDSASIACASSASGTANSVKRWLNPFCIRIDLGNPTAVLDRISPPDTERRWTAVTVAVMLTLVLLPWLLLNHWAAMSHYVAVELPAVHLILAMLVVWPLLKVLHEFAHAAVLRHFGGKVQRCGITFLFFMPLPFVDASDCWRLSSRTQRVFVSLAGVLAELAVACLCLWIWQFTTDGNLKALLTAAVLVACVSSVLINVNPLMKFDGYHVLQDLLNTTNLYSNASQTLKQLMWLFFGAQSQQCPLQPRWKTYAIYGLAALIFRLFVVLGICVWFIRDIPFVGSALACLLVFSAVVLPLWVLARDTFRRRTELFPGSHRQCRAVLTIAVISGLILALPLPQTRTIDGLLAFDNSTPITTDAAGAVAWYVESGDAVAAGDLLAVLAAPEVEHSLEVHEVVLKRHQNKLAASVFNSTRERATERAKLEAAVDTAQLELARLREQQANLRIHAARDGIVSLERSAETNGTWVTGGQTLGLILPHANPEVHVLVDQQLAAKLFSSPADIAVMPMDLSSEPVIAKSLATNRVDHIDHTDLALTRLGGGDIVIDDTFAPRIEGESYFNSRLEIPPNALPSVRVGQRVLVRYTLSKQPVATQMVFALRNTFFKYRS